MRRLWLILAIVALLAAACGGSDDETDVAADGSDSPSSDQSDDGSADAGESSGDETAESGDGTTDSGDDGDSDDDRSDDDDPDFSGSGSDDFCDTAREFEENDPFADLSLFDGAEFFDAADEVWSGILPSVPDEIRSDVETIIQNFDDMREIGEEYDYDFFNEAATEAMDALDTSGMEEATARFDAYLEDVCGITSIDTDGSDAPTIDPSDLTEEQIGTSAAFVSQILGIDLETAECLVEELGDITDPSSVDFDRLDEPICGTTLNELLFERTE